MLYHNKSTKYNDFNTSHVVVYLTAEFNVLMNMSNFNTSHVVVYRNRSYKKGLYFLNFNTSHVVVYQELFPWTRW